MNRNLLLRVTAPAVAIGLALLAACLAGALYINRLQSDLTNVLTQNVSSLQAAQELEIRIRQLRLHSLLYLMDPHRPRLTPIAQDERRFEEALEVARQTASTREEMDCVRDIEGAYKAYQEEQVRLRKEAGRKQPTPAFHEIIDAHPVSPIVDRCQDLLRINKKMMQETVEESQRSSWRGYVAMLALGLAGPVGGLVVGYGVARGLSRSMYRLSVRMQDMAQHLDQDVASVRVVADGDIHDLDQQMEHIVRRVEDAAQRLQQQQRELLRSEQLASLGQLAAGVAHEVRNPLTSMKMLVEAALRARNPRPLDGEDLRVIHREIARLEQTVQGFLDFARLPTPQRSSCDLRDLVRQARDLIRPRAEQQRIELRLHLPEQAVMVFVDVEQMGTVLVNLFINALDAMPTGGRLEVRLETAPEGQVRLIVADTGTGIAPQIADRLFTPFATTKAAGTGLGLSLSARILGEHGGSITAANRPEGGARFVILLPASVAEANHVIPAHH